MTQAIVAAYKDRVRAGGLSQDEAQVAAARRFDGLARELQDWRPGSRGLLGVFRRRNDEAPRGLYVHGAVGRGKTMLMDLFYESVAFEPKQRVHFHEFMMDIHARIAKARMSVDGDPIPSVARETAAKGRLLCLDELHVTDIADAMILGRLFEGLFNEGVVVAATSNAAPGELYRDGLNRALFLPFIDMIKQRMDVLELAAAEDYRLQKLAGRQLYFTPADEDARQNMDELWQSLTGVPRGVASTLTVQGRQVDVPEAAQGVARFDFEDLCAKPLGASDYLAVARAYHTVMIDNIPVLGPAKRNEARRFINLIDTLYDAKVGLVVSAAGEVNEIYRKGDGAYLFERTESRLIEMRSEAYLAARGGRLQVMTE